LLTVWPPASEPALGRKLLSPLYVTTTVCGLPATVRVDVEHIACDEPLSGTFEQTGAASIVNVTVPVGVPPGGGTAVTVAVNVTVCPKTDGFADEETVVVVALKKIVCSS